MVPEKRNLRIPSVTSIEEMKTPPYIINSEGKPKWTPAGKISRQQPYYELSPIRIPFGDVN